MKYALQDVNKPLGISDYGYYDKYHRFIWKESFLPLVQEFCKNNAERLK